ncbi:Glycosyltransferase [Thermoanaerobacter sp. YS13]|uniref:glycosyltransferase family 4 protein n=1 Tax=Thermoanaerobacter sp. YS13 TaxID=1511746 RepID=UPI000574624F|nr:glycosyltransferase family 4 protein [Thermoanaerobacter sp. YS13]KHO61979.1 Glycosyltransferase [Thermoanaerobacter sp. YS13]
MKQIALVVQRYGKEVLGGAETLAAEFAKVLKSEYDITVVTTTAKDYISWENYYEEGESFENDVKVVRFEPDFERTQYFHELNRIFLNGINTENFYRYSDAEKMLWRKNTNSIPISFQEELIKWQGPYSSKLYNYLTLNEDKFDFIIFFTYLYPTTYFGVDCINDKKKIIVFPTLHDEAHAYLPIWKKYRNCKLFFLTPEEKKLAQSLWGNLNGYVVKYGIEDKGYKYLNLNSNNEDLKEKYLIYAGRIDPAKGINDLIENFAKYKKEYPNSKIKLKLIGKLAMDLKSDKKHGIEIIGFVSEEEKYKLMSEALALVLPSPYESLSIVVLESFMVGVPVIVNGACDVLTGHVNRSKAGFTYRNYNDFKNAINKLLNDTDLNIKMKEEGRKYFLDNYEWTKYKENLLKILNEFE